MTRNSPSNVNAILATARKYVQQGFSVIPVKVDGTKSPLHTGWRQYANQLPTDEELVKWFASGEAGIGIPCGPASGNLVILDFECKHDINAHDIWLAKLPEHLKQAALGLPKVVTPSGGRHLYVRLPEAQPGSVLARYADDKKSVMIEIRGEGHQVVAPGSPHGCHPSGKPYEWFVLPDNRNLEPLDFKVFLELVEVAQQCTQYVKPEAPEYKSTSGSTNVTAGDDSPGTDFNRRGTWAETGLLECGWQWVRQTADDAGYLTRPGKQTGVSASVGFTHSKQNGWPLFYVWSTSTDFEAEQSYSKFAVYAKLKHGGDFKAATRALAALGYGTPRKPDPKPIFGDGLTQQQHCGPRKPIEPRQIASDGTQKPPAVITVPDCAPFPVDALPASLAHLVEHVSQVVDCEAAYIAMPCLAVIAGSIGGTLCISPKRGWYEASPIWSVVIGDSGTGKSPGQMVADYITRTINRELRERFRCDLARYVAQCNDLSKDDEEPERPSREYFAVKDITFERLAENLQTSPRGMILTRGELADWFHSFARYKSKGSGTDAARWIGCYDGEDISVERKSRDNGPRDIYVDRPAISVYGGIQPDIFRGIIQEDAYITSGLAARLLLAYLPKRCPKVNDLDFDEGMRDEFLRLVRIMRAWPLGQDRTPYVGLEYEARNLWKRYTNNNAERAEGIVGGPMAAVLPKMTRHSLRLALAVHAYQCAESEADPIKTSCSPDSMERAITLARWFTSQAERVYAMREEKADDRELRHLAELVRRKGGSITPRELQRTNCRRFANTEAATLALESLASAGLARYETTTTSNGKTQHRYTLHDTMTLHDTDPEAESEPA